MQIRSLASSPTLLAPRQARATAAVDTFQASHEEQVPPKLAQVLAAAGTPYYDGAKDAAAAQKFYGSVADQLATASPAESYHLLSDLVTSTHQPLDYKPRQYLYPWTDLQPSLRLDSVYSAGPAVTTDAPARGNKRPQIQALVATLTTAPPDAATVAAQIALMDSKGGFNCEHVVPKIWFNDEGVPEGDLHHLFTSDPLTNLERTNRKLTELPNHDFPAHSGEGWTVPQGNQFEPAGGKGEMARATLYFLLRYPGRIGDDPGEYHAQDLQTLLRWHEEFPVTLHERHRNQEIEKLQGNRNPLIDHPEWARKIDFTLGLC